MFICCSVEIIDMAKLIVDIADELHKKLKKEAIDRGITLKELVTSKLVK